MTDNTLIDLYTNDLIIEHGHELSTQTREAIVNYLIRGWHPGGFLTAMLAGDLFSAVNSADTVNCRMMCAIGKFIMHHLPAACWGSRDSVSVWCNDKNGIRAEYVTDLEKAYMWKVLQESKQ